MSRARQNLTKRMVQAGRRWTHISGEPPYGLAWLRFCERRGLAPLPTPAPEDVARKLAMSSIYGKFAAKGTP